MAPATAPKNQIFLFDSSATIADLLLVAKTLTNSGQKPKLRLVKSYNGEIESVAVDIEPLASVRSLIHNADLAPVELEAYDDAEREANRVEALGEMAVAGAEDNGECLLPDSAAAIGLPPATDKKLRAMLNAERWNSVTADTPVLFEGEWRSWGDLAGSIACEFNSDGVLVGKRASPRG